MKYMLSIPSMRLTDWRLALGIAVAFFALSRPADAQCAYPCWSEVASNLFSYLSYSPVDLPTKPSETPAIEFYYPMPTQTSGSDETVSGCTTFSGLTYDHYSYDYATSTYGSKLTGNLPRDMDFQHTTSSSYGGWKGIFTRASFRGAISSNPDTNKYSLTQAVFFHEDACYETGLEFGFYRQLINAGNTTQQNTVYFYYGVDVNCTGLAPNNASPPVQQGGCIQKNATPSSSTTILPKIDGVAIPIPNNSGTEATNSMGGYDWFWEAWLSDCSTWSIQVLDPYDYSVAPGTSVITHTVDTTVLSNASSIYQSGATGHASSVQQLVGGANNIQAGSPSPVVKVYEIGAAKSVSNLTCP